MKNAEVMEQLIKKEVIILGIANLSEFCGYIAENMTPGWSAVGGQTRSAYETGPPPDVVERKPGLNAWPFLWISSRSLSRLRSPVPRDRD